MGIDYNNLVRLTIKLMGLVFTVYAVTSFATYALNLLEVLKHGDIQFAWFGFVIPTCTYLAIGLFLWFFPKPIANTIVTGISDQQAHNLAIIAISLIGRVAPRRPCPRYRRWTRRRFSISVAWTSRIAAPLVLHYPAQSAPR